jgi:hypothetical protein
MFVLTDCLLVLWDVFTLRFELNIYIYIYLRFIAAPYSSPSTICSYQQDKRAKPGNLLKLNAVVEIGEHNIESTFAFFSP